MKNYIECGVHAFYRSILYLFESGHDLKLIFLKFLFDRHYSKILNAHLSVHYVLEFEVHLKLHFRGD